MIPQAEKGIILFVFLNLCLGNQAFDKHLVMSRLCYGSRIVTGYWVQKRKTRYNR